MINSIIGESVILPGTTVKNLAHTNLKVGSVSVYSQHPDGTKWGSYAVTLRPPTTYQEGVDYIIDYANGTIQRTASSSIPDWNNKPSWQSVGAGDIDGYNINYYVWVSYLWEGEPYTAAKNDKLTRLINKIRTSDNLKVSVIGMSVTSGGDAELNPDHTWSYYWLNKIKSLFSNIQAIHYNNQAIGGSTTVGRYNVGVPNAWDDWGLHNDVFLQTNVPITVNSVTQSPDLLIIEHATNDQVHFPVSTFETNIRYAVDWTITNHPDTDIVLVAPSTGNYDEYYPAGTRTVFDQMCDILPVIAGEKQNVAFVDVRAHWDTYLQRKIITDMLMNCINHPSSFGHIYPYSEAMDALVPSALLSNAFFATAMPFVLNSGTVQQSNVTLPIYSDSSCTILDPFLSSCTAGQENIIDKYVYNNTTKNIAVQFYDTGETQGLVSYSWDGTTYSDPSAWHILEPGEKHNFKVKVDLRTVNTPQSFIIGKRVRG